MPRWKWHLTRNGQPDPPDAIGAATDYPDRAGAYSSDFFERIMNAYPGWSDEKAAAGNSGPGGKPRATEPDDD